MPKEVSNGFQAAFWDILFGSIAGALGKTIEYPFDTIKVRMQTQGYQVFPTTWSCIKYTYENEGIIRGFFQGIGSPLIGASLEHACLFFSYNQCFQFLLTYTALSNFLIILISGAFAGSCTSLVLTPVELIKCQLQVSNLRLPSDSGERHTSIIPTIRSILKEKGIWGLWQGQSGTFIRESIGSLIWFGTFESFKSMFLRKSNREIMRTWQLLISGAAAGVAFNGSMFPVDTIKSIMQTEHIGFLETAQKVRREHGMAGFYRGIGITLLRSVPSNAIVFYTYEKLSRFKV
ncbi:similar to Saccharomyces cerevisiae YOR130C ORT1 Ornithine transporter of the mitochondrial inner membrane, exports ornithine from mitochondria as part of arginine biosynthesis [Maudiozyma barnettii]|uniref:Similar to Saccharomyces cerevisiae YOR130C ORT1 Ornithine transporter of the mitochondrial inner membrane, exports ornithine from mitochondria as part of arginine biosynthesis n=1 Tax=Maudiozyma barnettii TaxID=61262 RepID=A0A8H2VB81_9SACH|nr:Ort1p [Kazachstania barnettii]CAB4252042.1 similar to Saccharomyces cerevisiae YOR130C ORT1 Ornithine transporter of the mitochondrial inner membrane, exports ornithine from mitochondria as part of arginine biosynthesis [Kazachstania barnettii]CAD1778501.1 similar to Saccharomyces cerevisiae YOR130C ORT1 Ornithine transporter of the mitochondrial inner membrane, exports ornithine from mitochondria as part of arginine biosynthesis [Kazachstania barnettii]